MATKHTVTERALIGRVRRKLAQKGQFLLVTRETSRGFDYLGRYSIWESHFNTLRYSHQDLAKLALDLEVMHTDEVLDGEDERSERQREREQARQLLEGRLVPIDRTETRKSIERMLQAKPTVVTHVGGNK